MSDSKEFTSLFALIDNHLSKVSINSDGTSPSKPFKLPSLRDGATSSSSEGQIISPLIPKLPVSPLSASASSIKSVLDQQVANMLKAKQQKQREEMEKNQLVEGMQKLKVENDEDYVIDLMKALKTSNASNMEEQKKILPANQDEVLSRASSFGSLFQLKLDDNSDIETEVAQPPESPLPCVTDVSYILHEKVAKAKPSIFGKVLTSRLRPVAAPYLRENIESNIKPFDFSTPSPCDIYRQRLRKPTMSCTYTPIIDY